jgi:hypothetical protein
MRIISRMGGGGRQSVAYGWPGCRERQLLNRQKHPFHPIRLFCFSPPIDTHTHKVFFLSLSFFHRVDRNAIKNTTVKRSWPELFCWQIQPKTREKKRPQSSRNKCFTILIVFPIRLKKNKTKQDKCFQKFDVERVVIKLVPVKERLNQSIYGAKVPVTVGIVFFLGEDFYDHNLFPLTWRLDPRRCQPISREKERTCNQDDSRETGQTQSTLFVLLDEKKIDF